MSSRHAGGVPSTGELEVAEAGDGGTVLFAHPAGIRAQIRLYAQFVVVVVARAVRPAPSGDVEHRLLYVLGNQAGDVCRALRPLFDPPAAAGQRVVHQVHRVGVVAASGAEVVQHPRPRVVQRLVGLHSTCLPQRGRPASAASIEPMRIRAVRAARIRTCLGDGAGPGRWPGEDGPVAILVDPAVWPWRGRLWAHLVSDSSHEELHDFAARLEIPRQAFQGDHYDVPAALRERALVLGALPVPARELVARLSAAGLRRRKHH